MKGGARSANSSTCPSPPRRDAVGDAAETGAAPFLNRKLNAYFKHGEAEYFLARRDGRVVGRITAQIDFAYNQFHGGRIGMFGFIEFEDDPEMLARLLAAAEGWLRARGCEQMLGPMDFSLNEDAGVLIEGFELEPLIRQNWHPPYYQRRLEEAGLTKAMDLLSWRLSIDDRASMKPIIEKLAKRCREKYGVEVRKMTRAGLRKDLDKFAEVYNSAWSENWGFVPYSKDDLDAYALELQLVYTPEWFMVAEKDGETIAMAITVMDANQSRSAWAASSSRPAGGTSYVATRPPTASASASSASSPSGSTPASPPSSTSNTSKPLPARPQTRRGRFHP